MRRTYVADRKVCITCRQERPGEDFYRHAYVTSTGKASTRYESACRECKARTSAERRGRSVDKIRAVNQVYRERHKARLEQYNAEYYQAHRKSASDKSWMYHLRSTYGITIEDYNRLLAACGGRCETCGVQPTARTRQDKLRVDHDHQTGRVRGLLCHNCNVALGLLGDSPERLDALAAYLRRSRTAQEPAA